MLNFKIFALVIMVSLSFLGLVGVKVYVHNVQEDIAALESNRTKLKDEVQVLRAEWSNLNRPERLKSLSEQYLKFEQINNKKVKHFGNGSKVNLEQDAKIIPIRNDGKYNQVQWRYKPREFIIKSKK